MPTVTDKPSVLGEFELIRRCFANFPTDESVLCGIGDDCAVLRCPEGEALLVSIDTMVEGKHFLAGTPAASLAARVLSAATSDLAAMGGEPLWFTLALTLPNSDREWLKQFSTGLAETAARLKIQLVGGDTTAGPRVISVQVHGSAPADLVLRRSGAQMGDLIAVTGTLGDSSAGLELQLSEAQAPSPYLLERFFLPQPRIAEGLALRGIASACIDLSDGLLADLMHILRASKVGAEVDVTKLPLSDPLLAYVGRLQATQWALNGGEDFELCFTFPKQKLDALERSGMAFTVIGEICGGDSLMLKNAEGIRIDRTGYEHFRRV